MPWFSRDETALTAPRLMILSKTNAYRRLMMLWLTRVEPFRAGGVAPVRSFYYFCGIKAGGLNV
jgi:hypothetical protein